MSDDDCATCRTTGRKGYCALTRCYCGHTACPAFASWVDVWPNRGGAPDALGKP